MDRRDRKNLDGRWERDFGSSNDRRSSDFQWDDGISNELWEVLDEEESCQIWGVVLVEEFREEEDSRPRG